MTHAATTVLLGMNNPLSDQPKHALFPHPPGCAGWRLWRMLAARNGAGRGAYCAGFLRGNLLHARTWNAAQARQAGQHYRQQLAQGGGPLTVVVLGQATWAALGLPDCELIHPVIVDGIAWRRVPHPSGRSRWYNDPDNRLVVGMLLEELIHG